MTRWRSRTSAGEALSNVAAAPFLFGVLILVAATMCGGATIADQVVTRQILRAEEQFVAAGGDILRASADETPLSAAACADLADRPGVIGVSAVSQVTAQLAGQPDHLQTVLLASPGIEQIVDSPVLAPAEVIVSATLGERWSWDEGTLLRLSHAGVGGPWAPPPGPVTIGTMTDLTRLGDAASTSIIAIRSATGEAESCLVRIEPHLVESVAAALPAALGETADSPIRVDRQVYTGQFGPDPSADFQERPTQWAGLVAGAVIGLLVALVGWTRRQRSALYATLGVPWTGGFQIRLLEALVPVIAGIAWGAVWAAVGGWALGLPSGVVLAAVLLHGAAALAVATLVVVLAALWRPPTLQALKDR